MTASPTTTTALSDVLHRSSEQVELSPSETYREVTIKLWGKGVTLRRLATGGEIAGSRRFVVREGQFILSRIDARNGACGVVPRELEGAVVSNDFPAFYADQSRLDTGYLGWMSRTGSFVDLCRAASEGTTNRVRLREDRFLKMTIPLPPLAEQRRIVARIEELAAKIEEARKLKTEAAEAGESLYAVARDELYRELTCRRERVAQLFDLVNGRAFKPEEWEEPSEKSRRIVRIQNLKYPNAKYNWYSGPVAEKHLVCAGDVLFAWSGQVVSLGAHIWRREEAVLNQHIFNVKSRTEMLPEFVQEGFNALVDEMKSQVRGLEMFHIRKREVDELLFPVMDLHAQQQVVDHLRKLRLETEAIGAAQRDTAAELDALLPSILDKAFKGEL